MKLLTQVPVPFDVAKLKPVVNTEAFDLHYNGVYKNHVDSFNKNEGDSAFNKAGAFLHDVYFENIREYRQSNLPSGKAEQVINIRYGSYERFFSTVEEQVNRLQGNGWVFMNTAGYVNIIPNNRIVDNIALIIDCWEHSYLPTFGIDRNKYIKNHMSIINWDVVNRRILNPKKEED